MIWPLPRPNPPPGCCPRPINSLPPFAKCIVVVDDSDLVGIVADNIAAVDIVQAETKATIIQLAFVHYFSLSRYPLFSLATAEVIFNIFHHDLVICKNYNID